MLRQLVEAELIYRRGAPPQVSYVFKHALVQDTAYGSMLRSRRQRIHAQIATALKEHVTEEEYAPATIAHHFTEAGLAAPAASAWLAAAELALSQSAPVEAERHAGAGLALRFRHRRRPSERDALELALRVARANALVPLQSVSAPETFEAMWRPSGCSTAVSARICSASPSCTGFVRPAPHCRRDLNQALGFARGDHRGGGTAG